MYRVLMPVDDNEARARSQAEFVASLPAASDSIEVLVQFVFHGETSELPDDFHPRAGADRILSVRRAVEYFDRNGIDHVVVEGSGDTADDILTKAATEEVDHIVLGGRKRSPAGKVLFGSVAQSVMLNTELPVTVTGGTPSDHA